MQDLKNKEAVLQDYFVMIKHSWTYQRLTTDERITLQKILFDSTITHDALKGTYNQRWAILQSIYFSFITALGYKQGKFRETEEIPF